MKRNPGELFQDYKIRRGKECIRTKVRLAGVLIWQSVRFEQKHLSNGLTSFVRVLDQGTYWRNK